MLKKISIALVSIAAFTATTAQQPSNNAALPRIDSLIYAGAFRQAHTLIDQRLLAPSTDATEQYDLQFKKDLMHRILVDFSLTEKSINDKLAVYYPALTAAQKETWEKNLQLEMQVIDNEKRYFKNSVGNLFRLNAEARKVKLAHDGQPSDGVPGFLRSYLPALVDKMSAGKTALSDNKSIVLHYTLTLKPNVVPAGEVIRCWLPFPAEGHTRQSNIRLISTNLQHPVIAPEGTAHRSVYGEKITEKGKPTVFELEFSFDCKAERYLPDNSPAYNTTTELYKTNTAERPPHIVFSDRIKSLTAKIVGTETVPFKKVQLIYSWISNNIPWCSALEYSTMKNIPEYVLTNKHGDCGMQTLLFMTMARYAGIPCKWQSGWMLHPNEINLHDWCEVYYEGYGWVPLDQSFKLQDSDKKELRNFYISGIDGYRLIVNDDFSQPFFPAKIYPRSETVDFQRGELEWRGGNIYFDQWNYDMKASYQQK